jgi:hypothetical protein
MRGNGASKFKLSKGGARKITQGGEFKWIELAALCQAEAKVAPTKIENSPRVERQF